MIHKKNKQQTNDLLWCVMYVACMISSVNNEGWTPMSGRSSLPRRTGSPLAAETLNPKSRTLNSQLLGMD
jgi:hypothetical protein